MEYYVQPWAHQIDAIKKARNLRDLALFWEMGTGKTATTVNIIRERWQEAQRPMKTLILCPVVVVDNWREEIMRHAQLPPQDIIVLKGTGKQKIATLLESIGESKIVITNYESLDNAKIFEILRGYSPEILVCDESQRLKSIESKRSKSVFNLSLSARHCYILSGSPILNTPMDIFQQFKILDRGQTFGVDFYRFRGHFFEDKNANMPKHLHFPEFRPKNGAIEAISNMMALKALRVTKEECLDLPPLVREHRFVELGKEQKQKYLEMRDDFITWVAAQGEEPRASVANLAITKGLRLQQIVCGHLGLDDGTYHLFEENPRIAVLRELLEDICDAHKVIVWACWRPNYEAIAKLCTDLGLGSAQIHGEIKDKERELKKFKTDKNCKVMIANPKSAGIGISLIEAPYSIYYSKGFSLEDDIQSESRNHRGGSEIHSKITRIDLVAKGTIDEKINEALKKKEQISDRILDWKL